MHIWEGGKGKFKEEFSNILVIINKNHYNYLNYDSDQGAKIVTEQKSEPEQNTYRVKPKILSIFSPLLSQIQGRIWPGEKL